MTGARVRMRRRPLHVVVPGSTRTAVVTPDGEVVVEPVVVAVDRESRPRLFGTEAVSAASRDSRLELVIPYTQTGVGIRHLAAAHLDWLITSVGGRRGLAGVAVPSTPRSVPEQWADVTSIMAVPALVVSRAAVASNGLGFEAGSALMLIDWQEVGVEVSVMSEDGLILAEHCGRSSVRLVAETARSLLGRLDPDLELAIRGDAVYLIVERFDTTWVGPLAARLGVAVEVVDDPLGLLHAGVQADAALIEHCLAANDVRVRRPAYPRLGRSRTNGAHRLTRPNPTPSH